LFPSSSLLRFPPLLLSLSLKHKNILKNNIFLLVLPGVCVCVCVLILVAHELHPE
jgi:hypothetical protein